MAVEAGPVPALADGPVPEGGPCPCCDGAAHAGHNKCEKLRAWLTYHSQRTCPCNCHHTPVPCCYVPPYWYFLDTCAYRAAVGYPASKPPLAVPAPTCDGGH
jgi:hypothetical protein